MAGRRHGHSLARIQFDGARWTPRHVACGSVFRLTLYLYFSWRSSASYFRDEGKAVTKIYFRGWGVGVDIARQSPWPEVPRRGGVPGDAAASSLPTSYRDPGGAVSFLDIHCPVQWSVLKISWLIIVLFLCIKFPLKIYCVQTLKTFHAVSVYLHYSSIIWLPWQRPLKKWRMRYRSITHVMRFQIVKILRKSVQYIQRYSTKYAEPRREHATQLRLEGSPPKRRNYWTNLHQNFTPYSGISSK